MFMIVFVDVCVRCRIQLWERGRRRWGGFPGAVALVGAVETLRMTSSDSIFSPFSDVSKLLTKGHLI